MSDGPTSDDKLSSSAHAPEESPGKASPAVVPSSGRAGLLLLVAKVYFIVTGIAQQALLPKVIGESGYGALSRVLSASSIVTNVMIVACIQVVSRRIAAHDTNDERRFLVRAHAGVALAASLAFAVAAPLLAWFQRADYIRAPLLCMALVLGLYGLYAPLVGVLNGRRIFAYQGLLDVVFATLRTGGLVLGGLLLARASATSGLRFGPLGPFGSTAGIVLAVLVIVPVATLLVRRTQGSKATEAAQSSTDARGYFKGLGQLALLQLGTNLLMQVDIFLLGRALSIASSRALTGEETDPDVWLAVYRACQLFAFLPYQLLVSLTQVLFPMLARAYAEKRTDQVQLFTQRGARIGASLVGLMVSVIVANAGRLVPILYPAHFSEKGAQCLQVLAVAQGFFALASIGSTALSSVGRERHGSRIALVVLAVVGGPMLVVVPGLPFGQQQLLASAGFTAAGMLLALVLTHLSIRPVAGTFLPLATILRVVLAMGVAVVFSFAVQRALPVGRGKIQAIVFAGVSCAAAVLSYLAVLLGVREWTLGEVRALLRKGNEKG
jgi:stage V sporulation protein B